MVECEGKALMLGEGIRPDLGYELLKSLFGVGVDVPTIQNSLVYLVWTCLPCLEQSLNLLDRSMSMFRLNMVSY